MITDCLSEPWGRGNVFVREFFVSLFYKGVLPKKKYSFTSFTNLFEVNINHEMNVRRIKMTRKSLMKHNNFKIFKENIKISLIGRKVILNSIN